MTWCWAIRVSICRAPDQNRRSIRTVAEPTSVNVDTFGTATIPEERIVRLVRKHFDLTPKGIINALKLRRPVYKQTAAYGHFGREEDGFTWEQTNKAKALKRGA